MKSTREQGFSLLEVLVAFSIMALVLGALYSSIGSSVKLVGGIDRKTYALLMAQSLLDSQQTIPFVGWTEQGKTGDGFNWEISTRPLVEEAPIPPLLHEVNITVHWQEGVKTSFVEVHTILPELPVKHEQP